jgi:hypothetical protein
LEEEARDMPGPPVPPCPNVALSGLAFNQAINPFRSFAGIVFLATSTKGLVESRATGSKPLSKSYWSG